MKKEDKPLFSIVIVNYNGANYLEEAIKSVINQSFKNYELIIIDGASQDNSVEIIKEYATYLSYWTSEQDSGQSEAFNKGFKIAKGEFYFWLNADDLLLPNSLQYAYNAIKQNPKAKWFSANTIFFNQYEEITKCSVGPKWCDFLIKYNPIYVYGPTSIFHESIFSEAEGFDEDLHFTMDGDLWYRFYNNNHRFIKINKFFWAFRVHEESKTSHAFNSRPNEKFRKERIYVLKKNNHTLKKLYAYLLTIYKLISGSIFNSILYTKRLKNVNIKTYKN